MSRAEVLRRVLTDYHHSLSLARELALKLLDTSQPGRAPVESGVASNHRRLVGEALDRIEKSENSLASLWKTLSVDRRQASIGPPEFNGVKLDRRKPHR